MTDGVLEHLPRIDMVSTGRVTRVPDWYGDAWSDGGWTNEAPSGTYQTVTAGTG